MNIQRGARFRALRLGAGTIALLCLFAACGGQSTAGSASSTPTHTPSGGGGLPQGSCTPGEHTISGVKVVTFCGPAKAQATFGSNAVTWSDGMCSTTQGLIAVNIGTEVLDHTAAGSQLKQQYAYLGILVNATTDGTYPNSLVAGNYQAHDFALSNATVTISQQATRGTFTGTNVTDNSAVNGSWTCS